jgi:hypothetical protein
MNDASTPSYISDFFFYIGIASLSSDFTQPGCPDAPPADFASKYYAQVVPLAAAPNRALRNVRGA